MANTLDRKENVSQSDEKMEESINVSSQLKTWTMNSIDESAFNVIWGESFTASPLRKDEGNKLGSSHLKFDFGKLVFSMFFFDIFFCYKWVSLDAPVTVKLIYL